MSYHSHPLETENELLDPTRHTSDHESHACSGDFWAFDSPLDTVHPMDECENCHDYVKHIDRGFFSHSAASNSFDKSSKPERTFLDGIELGRRLQLDLDSSMLSRYRGRLQRAEAQHDESMQHRRRAEALEHELALVKDRLLALQMAYDDLSMEDTGGVATSNWGVPSRVEDNRYPVDPSPTTLPASVPHDEEVQELWEDDFSDSEENYLWRNSASFIDESDEDFFVLQQLQALDDSNSDQLSDYRHIQLSDGESDKYASSSLSSSSLLSALSLGTSPEVSSSSLHHASRSALPVSDRSQELSIGEIAELIEEAHTPAGTVALGEVRLLIQDAERTPQKQRTPAQIYLLLTWRAPQLPIGAASKVSPAFFSGPSLLVASSTRQEMFVDASPYGVGLIFGQHWLAWAFSQGHPALPKGQDNHPIMSWAELIAVELGVRTFIAGGYHNSLITIRSDNAGVVNALKNKKWTRKYGLDEILLAILRLCDDAGLELKAKWVSTKVNPADKPSRGVYPPKELMFSSPPEIPLNLQGLVELVSPQ